MCHILIGNIPSSIINISSLELIYLDQNNISGSIPTNLDNLLNLQALHLSANNLSGANKLSALIGDIPFSHQLNM